MMKAIPMLAAAFCVVACTPEEPVQTAPAAPEPVSAPAGNCPVIASRDWKAWIDAMPMVGADGNRLHIAGEVDLPTPGYSVELVAGPADRAMPPSQRFTLVATPPDGMVAQVVTPTPVKYQDKATYSAYRSIRIVCGDKPLATITEVPTTH